MAARHLRLNCFRLKPQQNNIKLGSWNGRPSALMACDGRCLSNAKWCSRSALQWQLSYSALGAKIVSQEFCDCYAISLSFSNMAAVTMGIAAHSTAHCWTWQHHEGYPFLVVWLEAQVPLQNWYCFPHPIQLYVPVTTSGLLDHLSPFLRHHYESDCYLAVEAFYSREMEGTSKNRDENWTCLIAFVASLGLDPYVQKTHYEHQAQTLSGIVSCFQLGSIVAESKFELEQLIAQSQPLAQQFPWPKG